jgi:hypothetical protein
VCVPAAPVAPVAVFLLLSSGEVSFPVLRWSRDKSLLLPTLSSACNGNGNGNGDGDNDGDDSDDTFEGGSKLAVVAT